MAKQESGCGALAIGAAAVFGLLWFVTAPSDDQVCRTKKLWLFDALHDIDYQPTCQQLIDQIEGQASDALRQVRDHESRIAEMESRLNM